VQGYLDTMSALEEAYPGTVFVYTTMPLTTDADADNELRNAYNARVRAYCQAGDKFLFDVADIEAWDPSGNRQTYSWNGQSCDLLYAGYAIDNGHLNATGEAALAKGWYAMAARIVEPAPEPGTALLLIPAAWLLRRREERGGRRAGA
jgi:lysophospholipase L1-like esterase